MKILGPFNEASQCPACGHSEHSMKFEERRSTISLKDGTTRTIDKSYVSKTCSRCGATWGERPLYKG